MSNFMAVGNVPIKLDLDKHQTVLLSANNGNGKCVDPKTKIDIIFTDEDTQKLFLEMFPGPLILP